MKKRKTEELKESIIESIKKDDERIENLTDEKDRFLANKSKQGSINAYAELEKVESEKRSNLAKVFLTATGVIAAVLGVVVDNLRRKDKKETNDKILDHQINLMEQYEKNAFDNKY